MSGTLIQATLWASGIIIIYAILSRGLFRATEAARLRALDISVDLCADERYPADEKDRIESALDDLHSPLAAWRMLIGFLRVLLVDVPFRPQATSEAMAEFEAIPEDIRRKHNRLLEFWVLGTLGNSPMVAFLSGLIVALAAAFVSVASLGQLVGRGRDGRHDDTHSNHHATA